MISIRQAARKYRKRPATLSSAVKRGEIPAYRQGLRTLLVDPEDVERWLRTHRIQPEPAALASRERARQIVDRVLARRDDR